MTTLVGLSDTGAVNEHRDDYHLVTSTHTSTQIRIHKGYLNRINSNHVAPSNHSNPIARGQHRRTLWSCPILRRGTRWSQLHDLEWWSLFDGIQESRARRGDQVYHAGRGGEAPEA